MNRIILALLFIVSILFAGGYVSIREPLEGTQYCENSWVYFYIELMSQMNVFGPDDNNAYYFDHNPGHGNPFWGLCRREGARWHHGIDISYSSDGMDTTRPIYAPYCGIVRRCWYGTGYGWSLLVYYPEIDATVLYAHLSSNPGYNTDEWLCQNTQIATGGNPYPGEDNPPSFHVHIEVSPGEHEWNEHCYFRENPLPILFFSTLDSLTLDIKNETTGEIIKHKKWDV